MDLPDGEMIGPSCQTNNNSPSARTSTLPIHMYLRASAGLKQGAVLRCASKFFSAIVGEVVRGDLCIP